MATILSHQCGFYVHTTFIHVRNSFLFYSMFRSEVRVTIYCARVDSLLHFTTYCVIREALSLTGEHRRLKSNNYGSSVYTTIIYSGLLCIYLQIVT
jgi:hypothetical protein